MAGRHRASRYESSGGDRWNGDDVTKVVASCHMTPDQILACTLWSEDRGGGAEGMEPIAGVILNRSDHPGWWGHDIVGVCLCPGQFDGWNWRDPNFRPLLTVNELSEDFKEALVISQAALSGEQINRANGATHYYAKSMTHKPDWALNLTPCFETEHHLFFKIGLGK